MHPYIECARLRIYPATVILTSLIGTLISPVYAADKPHEQEFVVTAYYSPLKEKGGPMVRPCIRG